MDFILIRVILRVICKQIVRKCLIPEISECSKTYSLVPSFFKNSIQIGIYFSLIRRNVILELMDHPSFNFFLNGLLFYVEND